MPPTVVVLSPEPRLAAGIARHLGARATVNSAVDIPAAEKLLASDEAAVLVCRDDLPGETGIMFLARYTGGKPWLKRMLICAPLDSDVMMHVINEAHVFRCVVEPCSPDEINRHVASALADALASRSLFLAAASAERPALVFASWILVLPRLAFLTLLTCGGAFAAGLATLILLYLLKSILGIDIFSDTHLYEIGRAHV